jgi:DNA repair exonuclease SbcCD ATPase subunit
MSDKIKYTDLFEADLQKQIDSLGKQLTELEKSMQNIAATSAKIKVSSKGTGKEYNDNNKAVNDLKNNTKQLTELQKQHELIQKQLVVSYAKKTAQQSKAYIELLKEREALAQSTRELKKRVQQETIASGSLKDIETKLGLARVAYGKLSKAERETSEAGKQLLNTIQNLSKEQDTLRRSMGQSFQRVGAYEDAVNGLFEKLGNLANTNLSGLSERMNRFIGVGIGIAAVGAAVFGVVKAFVALDKRMLETAKYQLKVSQSFGTTGQELTQQTALIKTLADTYGEDFNRVLIASNNFAKNMGISANESLTLISEGFA